jgi:hypothetical protein
VRRLADLEPSWYVAVYERDGIRYAPERHEDFDRHIHRPGCQRDPLFPEGRHGMGLIFACPVHHPGGCDLRWLSVPFGNPLDGGPRALEGQSKTRDKFWTRSGDTFETLVLSPSIKFPEDGPEHWHGHVGLAGPGWVTP